MKTKSLLQDDNSEPATAVDYETALEQAGQGKFQFLAMATIGLCYIAANFEMFGISFLLPSAECDLQMTTRDKGFLNSSPFVGILVGACWWGKLGDVWGRRSAIATALALDACAGLLSSLTQTFWPFLIFRFLTGFTELAAMPLCYPYLGEVHSSKFRGRALVWLEIFASLGGLAVPLAAWAIIPRDWSLGSAEIGFRYNSWRIFIAVCSVPSIICAIMIYFLPESPAFLLTKGRHEEALNVFRRIYHMNSGKPPASYPVKRLKMEVPLNDDDDKGTGKNDEEEKTWMGQVIATLIQSADIFRPPLLKNTMIGLSGLFSLQLGFFGFGMWFPELFNRFEEFKLTHPNQTASLCEVASMDLGPPAWKLALENASEFQNITQDCSGITIQTQVFINTFSIGLTTIFCAFLSGLIVLKIDLKVIIVATLAWTAACGAGTYFVRSSLQNLILSCALQAFNGVSFSSLMCAIIGLFPAKLRGLASTVLMNASHVGSIVGNLLFGLLIDVDCAIPVFTSAGVLAGCAVLCLFLPSTKNAAMS